MLDFNLWCFNSRVFPGIDPLVVRQGDKVQVRFGNLTMTNHPIHMHGYDFKVTGTDGGWVDNGWPEVSVDVAVGQMRAFEFVADVPGDWALHCHKSHHTMNAMGRRRADVHRREHEQDRPGAQEDRPGYMPMGGSGMGEMGSMEICSDNTLPMMTGYGQFGPSRWAACSRS